MTMMMMIGSKWLFRLFLFALLLGHLSNSAAKKKHKSREMSKLMSDWYDNVKYKQVPVSRRMHQKFCSSDDVSARFSSPAKRKEYHTLTKEERTMFHDCVNSMKNTPYMGDSRDSIFDMFVYNHRNVSSPEAHGGPAFCGFHREFLSRFETELRNINPKTFMPFLDMSYEAALPNPAHSAVFSDDYLGPSFGVVNKGFMANWKVVPEDCQEMGKEVSRECGNDGTLLITDDKVEAILKKKSFTDICTPYDPGFEEVHGGFHSYVGGHMMSLACAPNDICFFLHHANVDYIFERFLQLHPGSNDPSAYPDDDDVPRYHRKNEPMLPFEDKKNVDGLSKHYTKDLYHYIAPPRKCTKDAHCTSEILWCDRVKKCCKAKIMENGECTGLKSEACYCPGKKRTPKCVMISDVGICKCSKA